MPNSAAASTRSLGAKLALIPKSPWFMILLSFKVFPIWTLSFSFALCWRITLFLSWSLQLSYSFASYFKKWSSADWWIGFCAGNCDILNSVVNLVVESISNVRLCIAFSSPWQKWNTNALNSLMTSSLIPLFLLSFTSWYLKAIREPGHQCLSKSKQTSHNLTQTQASLHVRPSCPVGCYRHQHLYVQLQPTKKEDKLS